MEPSGGYSEAQFAEYSEVHDSRCSALKSMATSSAPSKRLRGTRDPSAQGAAGAPGASEADPSDVQLSKTPAPSDEERLLAAIAEADRAHQDEAGIGPDSTNWVRTWNGGETFFYGFDSTNPIPTDSRRHAAEIAPPDLGKI